MTSPQWVYCNGVFLEKDQAKVSITNRGFLFGEGVFTTLRVQEGNCEFYHAHISRLCKHAQELGIHLPFIQFNWVKKLIELNDAQTGIWRLKIIVTAKETKEHFSHELLMMMEAYQTPNEPYHLVLFPFPMENPLARIKSLSYLPYLYAYNYARDKNAQDCLLTNSQGYILETSRANIFWIDKGICWIPDLTLPYLKGILLNQLIEHLQMPIYPIKQKIHTLSKSASYYICNSLIHCQPILSIQGKEYPRNKIYEHYFTQLILQCLINCKTSK